MTYMQPDTDDDSDRERRMRAEAGQRRALVEALCNVSMRANGSDRQFIVDLRRSDLAVIGQDACDRLGRLAWQYRRDLPQHLRPKLPPFDPIVRAMEIAGV